jgi:hypothetical protein
MSDDSKYMDWEGTAEKLADENIRYKEALEKIAYTVNTFDESRDIAEAALEAQG